MSKNKEKLLSTYNVEESEVVLNIDFLSFEEGRKWIFNYEGTPFFANISDKKFLKEIEEGKQFSKGDTLRVHLKKTHYPSSLENSITEYEVTKVIEHKGKE